MFENEFKNTSLKLGKIMFSNNSTAQNISKDSRIIIFPQKFCSKSSNSKPADLIKTTETIQKEQ